jgi:hypothetical protein
MVTGRWTTVASAALKRDCGCVFCAAGPGSFGGWVSVAAGLEVLHGGAVVGDLDGGKFLAHPPDRVIVTLCNVLTANANPHNTIRDEPERGSLSAHNVYYVKYCLGRLAASLDSTITLMFCP